MDVLRGNQTDSRLEGTIKKGDRKKKRKDMVEEHLSLCNLIDPLDRSRRDRSTRPPIPINLPLERCNVR